MVLRWEGALVKTQSKNLNSAWEQNQNEWGTGAVSLSHCGARRRSLPAIHRAGLSKEFWAFYRPRPGKEPGVCLSSNSRSCDRALCRCCPHHVLKLVGQETSSGQGWAQQTQLRTHFCTKKWLVKGDFAGNKNKCSTGTHYNMEEPQKHHVTWKKAAPKGHVMHLWGVQNRQIERQKMDGWSSRAVTEEWL